MGDNTWFVPPPHFFGTVFKTMIDIVSLCGSFVAAKIIRGRQFVLILCCGYNNESEIASLSCSCVVVTIMKVKSPVCPVLVSWLQ